jgi:hypothetical protein
MIPCVVCGESVNVRQMGAHRAVTGWEELRGDGGANKIVLRKETGRWAHRGCISEVPGQESLTL